MAKNNITKFWLIGLCLGIAAGVGFALWRGHSGGSGHPQGQTATAPDGPREFAKAPAKEDLVTDLVPAAKQGGDGPLAAPLAPAQGPTPQDRLVKQYAAAKSEVGEPVQWTKPLALSVATPGPGWYAVLVHNPARRRPWNSI